MPQTPAERRQAILDLLVERGYLAAADLSASLHVDSSTIRRDLERLERAGLVRRTHGGALPADPADTVDTPYELRRAQRGLAKAAIGAAAAALVKDGQTLLIDNGSTTYEVAVALKDHRDLTVVTNDLMVAAFGESSLGAGRGAQRLLVVTLGTGVGVAMLVEGEPLRGRNDAHPEGGHIPVSSDTYRCYCGLTGCWEQHASRTALQNTLSQAMGGVQTTKKLVVDAMSKAPFNSRIQAAFDDYGAAVGRGLAALHALYQPERTVLGGSAAVCLPLIRESLSSALSRSSDFAIDVELRLAELGDNAGAIGAALRIAGAADAR